uniref:hypothetical protein n=1 Tax=Pedobacter schmidteae TaxID=2201271 RepID=UPI000EB57388|nr:hypothetical protein [Pedobacter schmidteae]
MKIFDSKSRIVDFSYNETFAARNGEFGSPSFVLNTFFPFKRNAQYFVLKWSFSYTDEKTKYMLFAITVHSEFAFEVENEQKDFQDIMKQLNLFYCEIVDFVRKNTEGYYDKLNPQPLVFDDVIDLIKAHGFYNFIN